MNGQTRARDADRTAACELIEAAYADGQLDSDEHDARVERALRAQTLGELDALTRDLQGVPPLVVPPRSGTKPRRSAAQMSRRLRIIQAAILTPVALIVIGSIVIAVLAVIAVTNPPNLFTQKALGELVDDVREDLGSTRVDDISVFREHAVLTRAQAGSPTRAERLVYRPGSGFDEFAKSTRDAGNAYVDLADVDLAATVALIERAPEFVNVSDSEPDDTFLQIRSDDGGTLTVYVSNEYNESGRLIADLDGEIREVQPYEEAPR